MIDGGNTRFHDDVRRAADLKKKRRSLCRCRHQRRHLGTDSRLLSDGRRRGGAVKRLAPIFTTLAPEQGWAHVGGVAPDIT